MRTPKIPDPPYVEFYGTMESLPDELLGLILEDSDFASQKSIRLVSKRCERVASEFVFRDSYMILLPEYLRKWQNIANSRLAAHVKTATIYIDAFWPHDLHDHITHVEALRWDGWLSQKTFSKEEEEEDPYFVRRGKEFHASEFFLSKEDIQSTHDHVIYLCDQYQSWQPLRESALLSSSLTSFSNLQDVSLMNAGTNRNSDVATMPIWRELRERTYLSPQDFYNLAWVTAANLSGAAETIRSHSEDTDRGVMAAVLRAMTHRGQGQHNAPLIRINGLRCCYSQLWRYTLKDYDPAWSDESWSQLLAAFDQLTVLDVCSNPRNFDPSFDGSQLELFEIARHAQNARRISITGGPRRFGWEESGAQSSPLFAKEVSFPLWPHIERLSLIGLTIPSDTLLSFLARHAKTLLHLQLTDVTVGNVPEFLSKLPELLALRFVRVESLIHYGSGLPPFALDRDSDASFSTKLIDYLLRKRQEMPDFTTRPLLNAIICESATIR